MSLRNTSRASSKTRVQNDATEQTIKSSAGVLQRILASNVNAGVQTVTVKDGSSTLIVLRIPAGATSSFEFGIPFATSLKTTNSHADVDALIIFD
jgi:hypothetical protein